MPPKDSSKSKAAAGKENDPTAVILAYVQTQNRPYSANDVCLNLKSQIPKGTVTKVLAQLYESQQIHGKLNGKQWVYVAKQEPTPVTEGEDISQLDNKLEDLKSEYTSLKQENQKASELLSGLNKALTVAELRTKLNYLTQENNTLKVRLEGLKSGTCHISVDDRDRIRKDLKKYQELWRSRRKMFREAWESIAEGYPGDIKELEERVGVETDEAAGVSFNLREFEV